MIRRKRYDEAAALTQLIAPMRKNITGGCGNALRPLVLAWAREGDEARAVTAAEHCENAADRDYLALAAIDQLVRRGDEDSITKASKLLRVVEAGTQLLSSDITKWPFGGMFKLLVIQGRVADAKVWIYRHLDDAVLATQLNRKYNDQIFLDGLAAVGEMARLSHTADSSEVLLRVIDANERRRFDDPDASLRNTYSRDEKAIRLKAGLINRKDVRQEAENAVDMARAHHRRYGAAADATLGAMLFALVDAPGDAQEALELAIPELLRLQPVRDRKGMLLAVVELEKYLDRAQLDRLAEVAATIADQQRDANDGDAVLHAIAPSLARLKSLHAGRRMAERIVEANLALSAYASLIEVHLLKHKQLDATNAIQVGRLPNIVPMNTGLPAR